MIGTPELVFFGIQAAVRLARAGRKIYVEDTAGRELVMPLPAGFTSLPANARQYAEKLARDPATKLRFHQVFERAYAGSLAEQGGPARSTVEQELVQLYLIDLRRGRVPGSKRAEQELAGIAALRQWAEGENPWPHPLQRVAGTLVEVAVDYFAQVPGAINEHSRSGKRLMALLRGLHDFDFEETRWDAILIGLFSTGLDFFQANPDLLADEDSGPGLMRTIVGGVATDLKQRLQSDPGFGDLDAEDRLSRSGQVLLRSLLRHAGQAAVKDPVLLGVRGEGGKALVEQVGSAFLSLLLDSGADDSLQETLQHLASFPALDKLVQAALGVVAGNPDYFQTGDQRLDPWLRKVITELHGALQDDQSLFDPTLFAEVSLLMLNAARHDLPLFNSDAVSFLIPIVQKVLASISNSSAAAGPKLSRTDLRQLLEAILGSVTAHPEWVLGNPANQALAVNVLPRLVQALAGMGNGCMQALIRGGHCQQILAATVISGLAVKLSSAKTEDLTEMGRLVWSALSADGLAGLDSLVASHRLTDLLSALARSRTADKLFGNDEKARLKSVQNLVAVVQELRKGSVLTVPDMVQRLDKTPAVRRMK